MKKSQFWLSVLFQGIYLYAMTGQLMFVLVVTSFKPAVTSEFERMIAVCLFQVTLFYVFYLYLFPKLLFKRKVKAFILFTFLLGIFTTACGLIQSNGNLSRFRFEQVFGLWMNFIIVGMIACAMRGFINWIAERSYRRQLEKKNKETSLALLKAQINPHFLFNTLNNIDVLIEKEPVMASAYLKKLSDILRFTLYEGPSETIPLYKEAGYIDQYIELQRIRTNNPDFVSFNIKGDTVNVRIAPMLFIPFIENAFKHCTNKKLNKAIAISIKANENSVNFNCSNAYDADAIAVHEKSGLGLGLIRSRLELLYPDNYQLDIDKKPDRFTINLSVNLV